jgi:hypothetical protein
MEEFKSAVFSLFKVAICDLELLQIATPMRRFQFARRVWRIYTFCNLADASAEFTLLCISPLVTDGLVTQSDAKGNDPNAAFTRVAVLCYQVAGIAGEHNIIYITLCF